MAMTRRQFGLSAASALIARSQSSEDLAGLSLAEASRRIRAGTVSPTQLTEACLGRIRAYNPKINAWITVMRDQALAQAKVLGEEQRAGRIRGPLHGIPIGIKDNIDTAGVRTTAASVVRHADCRLSSALRARFTFSRMSLALAVQMNGLGAWLW